jgi:hypothetical protein
MKHIEDEDIARMIEGKISKKERKEFLKHLAECDICLTIYSDTFKFMKEEKKRTTILKFSPFGILKKIAQIFLSRTRLLLSNKIMKPALAVLLIIILIVPVILNEIYEKKIEKAKIQQISEDLERMNIRAFSPMKDPIFAAIQAGIFTEDMFLLIESSDASDLKMKICKMLKNKLKTIFRNEKLEYIPNIENMNRENFQFIIQRVLEETEKQSLLQLFQFGRFIEHSILDFSENKIPDIVEVFKYRDIVQRYKYEIPQGVVKQLKKLEKEIGIKESKKAFENIKKIIFISG